MSGAVMVSPLAGKPAPKEMLVDPAQLEREYYGRKLTRGTRLSSSASAPAGTAARRSPGRSPSLLNLGDKAWMNAPGRAEGNWRWRCTKEMLSRCAFERLRDLTRISGRLQGGS